MDRKHFIGAVLIAAAWLTASFALSSFTGSFLPVILAQQIIFLAPGWIATTAIETFGSNTQTILVATVAGGIFTGVVIGVLAYIHQHDESTRRFRVTDIASICLLYFLTVSIFSIENSLVFAGFVAVPVVAAPILVYLFLFPDYKSKDRINSRAQNFLDSFARRAVVSLFGIVVASLLRYPLNTLFGTGNRSRRDSVTEKRNIGRTVGSADSGSKKTANSSDFDFGSMPHQVTPANEHYIVDINVNDPSVDTNSWSLTVDGAVENPYQLSYDELQSHESTLSEIITLLCISNYVGGPLISTGRWHGVPLSTLVDDANPQSNAVDIVTHAVDGYSEALPLATVKQQDILIAFGLNGAELPRSHGHPARLLVPGRYGMKSTKWLTRIEITPQEHDSYWEQRGWVEEAVVNTISYVRGVERRGDTVLIGGVAFAGLRGIDSVEVSFNDGSTWHEATLEARLSKYAWRRWRYVLNRPEKGILKVTVRAIDEEGTLQTKAVSDPHPGGSTGWHQTSFRV